MTEQPGTSRRSGLREEQLQLRPPKELRGHPQALRVPSMTVLEAEALKADIARRGIVVPLDITDDGVVLDGRHRHRAALELALAAVPVRIVDPQDQVDYMLSAALQRRQLTASQRAALVLDLDEYLEQRKHAARRKKGNLRNSGLDVTSMSHRAGRSCEYAAEIAGVSRTLIQQAESVKRCDPDLLQQIRDGKLTVGKAMKLLKRHERYAQIGPAPALPEGSFDLIYADPPWQLGSPSSPNSPEQHYPTLTTERISELAVPAAEHAVLFLWAVNNRLPDALAVIDAWDFTYKTNLVWVKQSIGLGNYARNRHELLLLATRGSYAVPLPERRPDSVVEAPRTRRHSEKPHCFYELLEQMYPRAQRLELFARGKARPGWKVWGNEATP